MENQTRKKRRTWAATAHYDFFLFLQDQIRRLEERKQVRTAETYASTLRSLQRFWPYPTLYFSEIDNELMLAYEAWLRHNNVSRNTSSFYMRILRAVCNRASEQGFRLPTGLFRHVYTGVGKTIKRAITLDMVRQLKQIDLSHSSSLAFARDMFLFSFYTRGMSFVDMASLQHANLKNGFLTYRRKKTGRTLTIRWEECMQMIVERYAIATSPYLLPIVTSSGDPRRCYLSKMSLINRNLKRISEQLSITPPLTMYVARHTWASVAKNENIPLSIISESMGHDSEATTQIYLASLNAEKVDRANQMIIDLL